MEGSPRTVNVMTFRNPWTGENSGKIDLQSNQSEHAVRVLCVRLPSPLPPISMLTPGGEWDEGGSEINSSGPQLSTLKWGCGGCCTAIPNWIIKIEVNMAMSQLVYQSETVSRYFPLSMDSEN